MFLETRSWSQVSACPACYHFAFSFFTNKLYSCWFTCLSGASSETDLGYLTNNKYQTHGGKTISNADLWNNIVPLDCNITPLFCVETERQSRWCENHLLIGVFYLYVHVHVFIKSYISQCLVSYYKVTKDNGQVMNFSCCFECSGGFWFTQGLIVWAANTHLKQFELCAYQI